MSDQKTFQLQEFNTSLTQQLGAGEELSPEEFEEVKIKLPNRPPFPLFIFLLALLKDFGDLITLGFLGIVTNIFAILAVHIWLMGRVGFMKRWMYRRFIFAAILGFIPIINMIPEWSIFVLRGHAKEYKKIDAVLNTIESFIKKV